MKIIMFGPPGSGKGTMSQMLAKEFGFFHVSAGALLREEIKRETEFGKQIKSRVESGKLVPDEVVVKLMKEDVQGKEKFILDGFPRTMDQARSIEDLGIDMVVYLEVADEVVVERFGNRRTDPVTGNVYNLKTNPPPQEIMDRVTKRKDDNPETVKDRLKLYHKRTQPLIKFYKEKGILRVIDGAPPPIPVYEDVKKLIVSSLKK